MKRIIYIISLVFLCLILQPAIAACESGHWIKDKTSDGSVIILDDESKWIVSPVDRVDTAIWLVMDNITIDSDDGCLINTDEKEQADATLVQ